jgi:hypothetical protein
VREESQRRPAGFGATRAYVRAGCAFARAGCMLPQARFSRERREAADPARDVLGSECERLARRVTGVAAGLALGPNPGSQRERARRRTPERGNAK